MSGPAAASTARLYSPRLLMLSAGLAQYPFDEELPLVAESRSRSCGSTIRIALETGPSGAVGKVGMMVTACAVGQSSAAIMGGGIEGKTLDELLSVKAQIESWLEGEGDPPDWPDFDALLPAREHRGRHGALLLPWNAATEALSSRATSS